MNLRIFLWALGARMEHQLKSNKAFKAYIEGKELVIQIQTQRNDVARYYHFHDGKVFSRSGHHRLPSLVLEFSDSRYAYELLANYLHDGHVLMKNVNRGYLSAVGDISLLTWFCALNQFMSFRLTPWRRKKANLEFYNRC